jgi:methionine sulfoxide reductase catalytic subunit
MTMHIRLKTLLLLVSPLLLAVAAAYVQWGTVGLPVLPVSPTMTPETAAGPYGFPAWLRITHYVNFLFLILLIRSGLQILMDHPRLYWNVHCTPRPARIDGKDAGAGASGPVVIHHEDSRTCP